MSQNTESDLAIIRNCCKFLTIGGTKTIIVLKFSLSLYPWNYGRHIAVYSLSQQGWGRAVCHNKDIDPRPQAGVFVFAPVADAGIRNRFKPCFSRVRVPYGAQRGCGVMVAMRVLETRAERRGGSIPFIRTNRGCRQGGKPGLNPGGTARYRFRLLHPLLMPTTQGRRLVCKTTARRFESFRRHNVKCILHKHCFLKVVLYIIMEGKPGRSGRRPLSDRPWKGWLSNSLPSAKRLWTQGVNEPPKLVNRFRVLTGVPGRLS